MKHLLFITMLTVLLFQACDIPYTGDTLSVRDVDKYLEKTGGDTVCLQDGFDSVCLKVIPGPRGKKGDTGQPGADGVDGIDGKDGVDGKDGKDGADNIVPPHYHDTADHEHPHAHDLPNHSHALQTHSHTHHHDVPVVNTGHSAEAVPSQASQPQENNVQETGFVATTPPPVSSPPVTHTPPPVSTPFVSTPQPIPERHPQPAEEPEPMDIVVEEPEPVDDALPEACGRWTSDSHEHDNSGLVSDYSAEQDRRNLHAGMGRRFREYYDVDEYSCGFHYHGDDHSDAHRHSSRANY